jgi:GNAT superfamily N-acetyltransferase
MIERNRLRMENYEGLVFEKFVKDDVEKLSETFKRAFEEDSRIHEVDAGGPPGYDNGDFLRHWYLQDAVTAFTIAKDGRLIGGIALWINENKENFLGNVFLDPDYQNKGLGTLIWKFVEQKYPDTIKWHTDTPGFSRRNHAFYVNKCGFKIVKINDYKDKLAAGYILEKIM